MAYTGKNEKGEWGLALSSAAQGSLIDITGASPMGDPVPAGNLALQLGGRCNGGRWSTGQPDDGDRGCPGTRGGGDKEEEHELGGPQEEVLVVAKRKRKRGVARASH
jgi:hypothetical protein